MTTHAMNDSKSVAFIVARLGSSRLPGKQLRTIGDTTVLQWITNALQKCQQLDYFVVTTVAAPENEPLRKWCQERHIDCFWYAGETDHVTTRLRKAAEHYQAGICLLISADCPLIDPIAVDTLIINLKAHPETDYVTLPPNASNQSCMLQGVQVATCKSWQRGDDLSDRPELKEHQFPIFFQRPDLFTPLQCQLDSALYGQYHRLSIDTWSDLQFCNRVYAILKEQGKAFTLNNVVTLLQQQPHLKAINQHVHQKRLIEQTQRVLIAFPRPPLPDIFKRSLHVAQQIIDRFGWPVTMLNVDGYKDQLNETGMSLIPMNDAEDDVSVPARHFDLLLLILEAKLPRCWKTAFHNIGRLCLLANSCTVAPSDLPTLALPQQDDDAALLHLMTTIKTLTMGEEEYA